MSTESLLQWPISLSNGKVMSQWLGPWSSRSRDGTSIREDRNVICGNRSTSRCDLRILPSRMRLQRPQQSCSGG